MELQGYVPYTSNTPREITTRDKLVFTQDGKETLINVLLTRRTNLICRREGETGKFELFFTVWSQEDPRFPLLHNGSTYRLFVPVGAAPAAAPAAKREKPAKGESKPAAPKVARTLTGSPSAKRTADTVPAYALADSVQV